MMEYLPEDSRVTALAAEVVGQGQQQAAKHREEHGNVRVPPGSLAAQDQIRSIRDPSTAITATNIEQEEFAYADGAKAKSVQESSHQHAAQEAVQRGEGAGRS